MNTSITFITEERTDRVNLKTEDNLYIVTGESLRTPIGYMLFKADMKNSGMKIDRSLYPNKLLSYLNGCTEVFDSLCRFLIN